MIAALLSSLAEADVLATATDRVNDGSLVVALLIAFGAGVVSFLSPCVLPLVPAYLSYVTGMSVADLRGEAAPEADAPAAGTHAAAGSIATATATTTATRSSTARSVRLIVRGTLGFVLGTAVVFMSFGALFGSFGEAMQRHAVGLGQIFGVVTIVLGLLFAGVFSRIGFLNRDIRIHRAPGEGLLAAPILGITFALGWTPCIGPTLGVVLGLAASSDQASAARGAALLFAYCLGLGVPLLVTGLAFNRAMAAFGVIRRNSSVVMMVSGGLLVLLGILQVTGVWNEWMSILQTRFGGAELPL